MNDRFQIPADCHQGDVGKSKHTQVVVERIVADIDAIVKQVRSQGWQNTAHGEREVRHALRCIPARRSASQWIPPHG
jgi:hypothetical protein